MTAHRSPTPPASGLDPIDRHLLRLLDANGREPTASLARKVGLSRSAVQERLSRLERDGVIEGYTIRLGLGGQRPGGFHAHVFISLEARQRDQVYQALRIRPEVRRCHTVSGEFDAIAQVVAETPEALDRLLDEIGRLPGVRRTQSAVVLGIKFER